VTTLADYAARVGGKLIGDGTVQIDRVAAIDDVDDRALTFATDERYLRAALASRAAAVLTESAIAEKVEDVRKPLVLDSPSARAALGQLLKALEPPRPPAPYRDPSAVVDPSARIGADVHVGPLVHMSARGAEVGAGCVVAGGRARRRRKRGWDAGSTLHPRAMLLERCIAGARVVLQAGADGGQPTASATRSSTDAFAKIPQVGNVVLGDDVEIGANTCIDRAQTGSTTYREPAPRSTTSSRSGTTVESESIRRLRQCAASPVPQRSAITCGWAAKAPSTATLPSDRASRSRATR
jgi:UDP-3-O-[3-hydroxymyristoyl] glucosamine N-acyltransferase